MANYGKITYQSDGPHTECGPKDNLSVRVDTIDLNTVEKPITHDPLWIAVCVIGLFCFGLFLFVAGRLIIGG